MKLITAALVALLLDVASAVLVVWPRSAASPSAPCRHCAATELGQRAVAPPRATRPTALAAMSAAPIGRSRVPGPRPGGAVPGRFRRSIRTAASRQ